jgi:hypothetical protein
MNRNADMAMIRRQMEGIIALLLALATTADRACRAPFPARVHVLSILRPAESVAREYVYGEMGLPAPLPAHSDDHVADAANLAARFRVLAVALAGIIARLLAGCRLHDSVQSSRIACIAAGVMSNAWSLASPAQRPFDTS